MTKPKTEDAMTLRGFYRLQIVEDDKVVGESGWQNNTITNNGFDYYLIKALVGQAGSSPTVAAIGLGYDATKTFAATDTNLTPSSCSIRMSGATASSSRSAQFTAAFSSNMFGGTYNINEIGLFSTTNTTGATAFALATYASSSVATNQAVNVTYNIAYA